MTYLRTVSARGIVLGILATAVPMGSVAAQFCPFKVQAKTGTSVQLQGVPELGSRTIATLRHSTASLQYSNHASATSRRWGLSGYCSAYSALAVTWGAAARSRWTYPVRFPAATNQNIAVQLQLVSTGSTKGSAGYSLDVMLFDDVLGLQIALHKMANLSPGIPIPPLLMNVATNKSYRLEVDVTVTAFANQGSSVISNRVTFAPQPFILPAGVSAESFFALIKNNSFNPPTPVAAPVLTIPSIFLAGQSATVNYAESSATLWPVPPVLLIGPGTEPSCNVAIGPNFGLSVLNPLLTVPFTLNPNLTTATMTFQVPPGTAGAQIIFQAALITGPNIEDLYSSNAEPVVVHDGQARHRPNRHA